MRHRIGLPTATLLVMGSIIGVGIFFNPAKVAERAGSAEGILLVWGLGALAAACGAATFAELGLNRPRAGGWFVYLLEAFGPRVAFLFAWTILGVVSTASLAVVADTTAGFAAGFLPALGEEGSPRRLIAAAALPVALTALAAGGLKLGTLVQNACMATKLLALAALAVVGFAVASPGSAAGAAPAAVANGGSFPIAAALLPVLFTYGGWQNLCYIASEVREPARTLPRAILLGVLGVAVVYLTVNVSMLNALGVEGLAGNFGFASDVAREAGGALGERILSLAMTISALGVCLVIILVTPWIAVAMSQRGLFPAWVGAQNERTGAPTVALGFQLVLTLGYLLASRSSVWAGRDLGLDPSGLVDSVAFAEWFFHGLVAFGLLRFRRQADWRRLPFARFAPFVYLGLSLWIVGANLLEAEFAEIRPGLAVVGIGLIVALTRRFRAA